MGNHEAYQLAMHTLDQYRGTVVACNYRMPPSLARPGSLDVLQGRFYDALTRVVLSQPHMQVGITGEDSKSPAFVRLEKLDLRNHADWREIAGSNQIETAYLESMQTQLDSRYKHLSTQPGWRVVVLHEPGAESMRVLYVWNHVHHDGMSAKIFHQQLLRHLNESLKKSDELTPPKDPESPARWVVELPDCSEKLPPNPELLSSWPMTPAFLLRILWRELKPPSLFPPGNTHATWAPIQASPYATRFHTFTVDCKVVSKLVNTCRSHRTTLTGLIHALVLVSLTYLLGDMKGFASRTPFDLRHVLPSHTPKYPWLQPKESMCNYVSVVEHEFDNKVVAEIRSKMTDQAADVKLSAGVMEVVWSVSARVRREIEDRLELGEKNDLIGVMKFVSDWRTQQRADAKKARQMSWLVTNLGVIDGGATEAQEQEEGWSLRRAELVLSAEVPSAAISVSVMTVKEEKMCITCSWQECVVDPSLAEGLVADLERWLNEIGASSL